MKNTLQIYRFLAFLPNDFYAFLLYLIFFNQKGGDVNLFLLFLIDLTSPNKVFSWTIIIMLRRMSAYFSNIWLHRMSARCASHFTHRAHNITGTQRIIFRAECPSL